MPRCAADRHGRCEPRAGAVLAGAFGRVFGHPALRVIDSTDPAEVAAADRDTAAARTLVIVSSKSGTTLETDLLRSYFQAREAAVAGRRGAGARFIAITDPDSTLDTLARSAGYRRILHGVPGIGGRFSALSPFGLAPAAMAGVDVEPLLQQARAMVAASGPGKARRTCFVIARNNVTKQSQSHDTHRCLSSISTAPRLSQKRDCRASLAMTQSRQDVPVSSLRGTT